MAKLNQYKVWCNTDSKWEYVWLDVDAAVPVTCPTDPVGHTIDGNKTAVNDTTVGEDVSIGVFPGPAGPMGEMRTYDPPNRPGFYRCDRDIRLRTAKLTDSFVDKGQNLTTFQQTDWDEVTLFGVKKLEFGNPGDDLVDCTSDGDAALNAVLSIWDFHAHDHSDPVPANCNAIPLDLLGGRLYVDPILETPTDEHIIYAIAMPEIAGAYGGKVPFFDSYLDRSPIVESLNFKTISMDPISPLDGSPLPAMTKIRFFVWYPKGKEQEHTLQIVMYRQLGTWENE